MTKWTTAPAEPTQEMCFEALKTNTRFGPRAMASIYRAMLSVAPHYEPKLKPLDWIEYEAVLGCWTTTIFGRIEILYYDGEGWGWRMSPDWNWHTADGKNAAKAGVEAEITRRILSTLEF